MLQCVCSGKFSESLVRLSRFEDDLDRLESRSSSDTGPDVDEDCLTIVDPTTATDRISSSAPFVDVDKLSQDAIDLHTNLVILRTYQISNVEAFQEITRKYDKVSDTPPVIVLKRRHCPIFVQSQS